MPRKRPGLIDPSKELKTLKEARNAAVLVLGATAFDGLAEELTGSENVLLAPLHGTPEH